MPSSTDDPTKVIQDHQFGYVSQIPNSKNLLYNNYIFCTARLSSALAVGITTLRLDAFARCVSTLPGLTNRCMVGPALFIADLDVFPTAVTLGCVVLSARP